MKELKGSKTEANLLAAFAGESQARNKYTYYASKAKKDGYEQIAELFTETANNEKEHAKIWFKLLHGGIGSTPDNLKDAAAGENYEWTDMYAGFAKEDVYKRQPYISQVAIGKLQQLSVFGNDYDTHDGTGVRDYKMCIRDRSSTTPSRAAESWAAGMSC